VDVLGQRRKPWCCCLVAAFFFSAADATGAAEVGAQETGVPGTEARRIDEPVFGGQMVVYEAGRGNAREIMLVHGIGPEAARDFRDHIAWLKRSFHVVAVDLPGFGQSDKANVLYSPANYARVLKHVAGRFLHGPFVLLGHSMGAVVCLRYAATYPDDVLKLVVVDAPGVLHSSSTTNQFLAHFGMEFVPPAADPAEWLISLARKLLAPLQQLHLDPQIILSSAQLRQRLLGGDPTKIAGLAVASEDLRRDLPKIRAETLIVWGAQDTLAPLRTGKVLALKLPRARLAVIERAGHELMLEAPERFRAVLEPFLERGLPPAPAIVAAPLAKRGEGTCRNERNRVFEGEYDRLILDGCRNAQIRNARVRELHILDSTVTLDDSDIVGDETGLSAYDSTIVMTGGRIQGKVAIAASASRLDLAAVEVVGREAAVTASEKSYVVFSLSRVRSPITQGELHDFYTVTEKNPM
ncbi:MAG TPA: alpha/beta hydrolase, partial [Burkholderiales bacterium]|nr:alpha/beta hydrolase [Burkholderiales bacterium]